MDNIFGQISSRVNAAESDFYDWQANVLLTDSRSNRSIGRQSPRYLFDIITKLALPLARQVSSPAADVADFALKNVVTILN